MNEPTDVLIVQRIREGDQGAFSELVRKHQRAVHGYAYHKTQDAAAAEDVTQEVFLVAYTNLHQLREPGKAASWLRSIAQFKSIDWLRQQLHTAPLPVDLASHRPSTLDQLVVDEANEHLNTVLGTLSEPNRITFVLRYMEGLSNQEIADFLDVSPSVIATRLGRIRGLLREHLISAVERTSAGRDFSKAICRQIQSVKPIIGVGISLLQDHQEAGLCRCIWDARVLAKQTKGVCREYQPDGFVIWYGLDRTREDDTLRAAEAALQLHCRNCPAGPHTIIIGQVLSGDVASSSLLLNLMGDGEPMPERGQILVDSTIAWLMHDQYDIEEVESRQRVSALYRLIPNTSPEESQTGTFIGRADQVGLLDEAIHQLAQGASGIVQITGMAGIGKTRLLRQAHQHSRSQVEGGILLWIESQVHQTGAHTLISQAFAHFLSLASVEELRGYLESFGLGGALPYFAEWLGLPVDVVDRTCATLTSEQIRYRAFQGACDWLTQLALITPVVWVVEDTHWLSAEESRMLQYLCRATRRAPVLFLLSRRTGYEEIPEAEAGVELANHVTATYPDVYREVHLEPLETWASHSLLRHHLGSRRLFPSQWDRVRELAGGNPLYLREVARLFTDSPEELSIPPSVERLILAHLDLLPLAQQNFLRYASVMGMQVDLDLLRAAFPELDLGDSLESLTPHGWLQRNDEAHLKWGHDLYRETIYHSIEPTARRRLHAEIACQLEADPDTSPELLADHYHMAGEAENAARYAAMALVAHQGQQRNVWIQRYADIALACPQALSREQHVEVLRQYARRLSDMGNRQEAIIHLEQALDLTVASDQHALLTIELADIVEDPDHKMALQEKVLSWLDEATDTDTIMTYYSRLFVTRNEPAGRILDETLRILYMIRNRGNGKAEARILNVLAQCHLAAGELVEAVSDCQRAIQIAETLGDNGLMAAMEYGLAHILWEGFRSPEAIRHLQKAYELYEQEGTPTTGVLHLLAGVHGDLGQYEAMVEVFENVLEQQEMMGDISQPTANVHARLVQGYVHLGDWSKAYRHFWRMLDSMAERPSATVYEVENAIGMLCYGDMVVGRWMWENISQTMKRTQELIRALHEHRFTGEDAYARAQGNLHPVLAAGYVEHGVKASHEEGVALLRLFARQVWILDEHVEFWAYLVDVLERDRLEAIFQDVLVRVEHEEAILPNETGHRPEFFLSSKPEKLVLEWLRACLREHHEKGDEGQHLRAMGIIPEPCWLLVGTFDESVPTAVEQDILQAAFEEDSSYQLNWRVPTDVRDGHVDCRHLFDTTDRVSAYACTTIVSSREQPVCFTLYHDDSICVWLNGQQSFEEDHCCYSQFDAILCPGTNRVLIRLTNFEGGWGFILRVTDDEGQVVSDLAYSRPDLQSSASPSP